MEIRPLFTKYQRQITSFANSRLGRMYLGAENLPILKLTPDGITYLKDIEGDRVIKRTVFNSRSPYLKKLRTPIEVIAKAGLILPYLAYADPVWYPALALTTSDFNPDADPETSTVDGYTQKSNGTYATAVSGDADSVNDSGDGEGITAFQHSEFAGVYYSRHPIYLFDTSSLGTDTIDSGTFSVYRTSENHNNEDSDTMDLVTSNPASNTSLAVGDHDSMGSTSFGNINIPATGVGDYVDITINSSGLAVVNKSGITKYGLLAGRELSSTAPDGLNQVEIYFADSANDPILQIVHSAGVSTAIQDLISAGVIPFER